MQNASAYANAAGGHAALLEFQKKDGPFSQGNRYIYAYTTNFSLLAHPYERDLVATNRMNWTDARGLPMMRIAAYTASHGGGFIVYLYPDRREVLSTKKRWTPLSRRSAMCIR